MTWVAATNHLKGSGTHYLLGLSTSYRTPSEGLDGPKRRVRRTSDAHGAAKL